MSDSFPGSYTGPDSGQSTYGGGRGLRSDPNDGRSLRVSDHPANPVRNEEMILILADAVEDAAVDFKVKAEAAANADADFKKVYNRAILMPPGEILDTAGIDRNKRLTEIERKAVAHLAAEEEYRLSEITKAQKEGAKAYQAALSEKLNGLRTISANYRAQA